MTSIQPEEGRHCKGCGLGWSRECDNPNGPCGCGAWHTHDPMVKSRCRTDRWNP